MSFISSAVLDIDACAAVRCHKYAVCSEVNDMAVCTCIEGYTGDGFQCSKLPGIVSVIYYMQIKRMHSNKLKTIFHFSF